MPASIRSPVAVAERLELVISRDAYDAAVRRQFNPRAGLICSIGPIRWRPVEFGIQMLVDQMEIVPGIANGSSRPPNESFLVLFVAADRLNYSAQDLLGQITPRDQQQAVGFVVQTGPPAGWDAAWSGPDHQSRPLDVVRISGPAPLLLSRHPTRQSHSAEDRDRWSRHSGALGNAAFESIRRAEVTLVGAGRNGALCAQSLAALGIPHLRFIDGDRLKSHNIVGTIGLDDADLGISKVQAVARSVLRLRPEIALACRENSILNAEAVAGLRLESADLLVSCVDDDAARLATWLLAHETLVPHLDIATAVLTNRGEQSMLADVRLFIPGLQHGCPVCVGGVEDLKETLYLLNAPARTLRRGQPLDWAATRAGSMVSLNLLAVGAGLQLWIDYLAGRIQTSAWQRLRWVAGEGLQSSFAGVATNGNCPFCRR